MFFSTNNFRMARMRAKMTQKQAAEKIGVEPNTILVWERGDNIPNSKNLAKAAEVYGCTVQELISDAV